MSFENPTSAKTPENKQMSPEMISTAAFSAMNDMVASERMELNMNMKGSENPTPRYRGKAEKWIEGGIAASLETFVKLSSEQAQDAAQYVVVEAKALTAKIKAQIAELSAHFNASRGERAAA